MNNSIVYKIDGNRYWDVLSAEFVTEVPSDSKVIELHEGNKVATSDYLARTLRFYGYPLGELMTDEEKLMEAKAERADVVSKIVVDVDGMKFDGDETSQERMSRTITAAVATGEPMTATTTWVLADNTIAQPSIQQLAQALRAAGEQQMALWTVPYDEANAVQPAEEPTTEPETEQPADTEVTE